ncbi:histidine--tRNA ligase [Candidatus Gottesmanbacteria bacterium RBG_16_43_7]|uniref:Histidine--tRNA ligase n=1 Tax=Candidatus Gottesmanbacteria bacterium RBG_16_43_7 TaxID=1798373 RepID=A0A1F5Z8E1_9BACT|nr:MAG: histidine--tRNA ligase [Candidatus Gottesmanbacteria bacterium RBG_16_43_7]
MVQARKLPGFRDFFAEDMQIRQFVINTFKVVFEKYGYEPLETPALEYTEIFTGEAGEEAEKLFFKFKDQGDRSVMLKYEVMIGMCRAVAENIGNIPLPYKRYQIQNVWRAERPQKGRYREFTQCDADTIGSSSVIWDAEFIQMGIEVMQTLGFDKFRANISNRKFLNGLVIYTGATQAEFIPICLSIDKLPKIGRDEVFKELTEKRLIKAEIADKILNIITTQGDTGSLLNKFKSEMKNVPMAIEGLNELEQIFKYLSESRINSQFYLFAPFIARGLAYYTGPIWEFEITNGNIGSVAGCGRYDNTIGRFLGKQIPATGGSFGIERITEVIKDRKMISFNPTTTQVMVTIFNDSLFYDSLKIANTLRKNNIKTMLYSDPDKLDKQLKYADRKGIPFVLIQGPDEAAREVFKLKNMKAQTQQELSLTDIITLLNSQSAT